MAARHAGGVGGFYAGAAPKLGAITGAVASGVLFRHRYTCDALWQVLSASPAPVVLISEMGYCVFGRQSARRPGDARLCT